MKKSILLPAIVFAMATPLAAVEVNDTIIDVSRPQRVVLEENDSTVRVAITGQANDSTFRYNFTRTYSGGASATMFQQADKWDFNRLSLSHKGKTGKCSRDLSVGLFSVGFVTPLGAPSEMNTDMLASYEIMLGPVSYAVTSVNKKNTYSIGLAGTWRNYRMNGATRFIKEGEQLRLGAYPEGAEPDFSRIKVISSNILFGYIRNLNKDFSLSLYGILNLNGRASIKTRYKLDGKDVRELCKKIHHRPVTIDFMAHVNYKLIGFYVKYTPTHVLNTDFGPSFQSLSTGITFFW